MPGILTLALLTAFTVQPSQPPLLAPTDRSDTLAKAPNQPGDIPIELMLDPAVGTTQVVDLIFDETFKTWDNADVTYDVKLPPRTFTLVLEVTAEDLTFDERTVAFRIESVTIDQNALTGKFSDSLKQSLQQELLAYEGLSGITGTFTLHAMGRLSDFTPELPAGTDAATIERQLRAVTNALTSLVPAIPAQPVGLNATWSIESLDKLGASSVRWPINCELTSLAGDILHVTMTGDTYIDVTVEQLPELPDGIVNKKAERRYALHTTTNHNPRLPVPSEATSVLTTKLDAEYLVADRPATFRSESIITTTLRERTSEITFRQEPLSPEDTAARAALEGTVLEVIDDGATDGDELEQLAYPAGQGPCEVVFSSAVAQVSTGSDATGGVLPAVRCSFDVSSDDNATTWTLRDVRVATENQPQAAVNTLKSSLEGVLVKPMQHRSLAAKIYSKATQFGDQPAGPTKPNMLLELTSLVRPPLPFEPVAKGATWNFARPWIDSETGAPIWQSGQATLVDRTADTFTIECKISSALIDDTHTLADRYLNGLKSAKLNTFTSGTRVRVTWKHDLAVPLEAEVTHAQRTTADVANWLMSGNATNYQAWTANFRSAPAFTDTPAPAIAAPTSEVLMPLERDTSRRSFRNFQLTNAGDEPRSPLAYRVPPADADDAKREIYCLSVRQRAAQSNGTQQLNTAGLTMHFVIGFDAPPQLFTSTLEPDANAPAFRNLRWNFLDAFVTLEPDAPADQQQLAKQYTEFFKHVTGAQGVCSLQPTGEIIFENTTPAIGALPAEEKALRELHEWIARIFEALPKEPVGPSATWSRDITVALVGVNDPCSLVTTLTKREGDLITLATTAKVTARNRFIYMPNLPHGRAASALEATTTRTIAATLDPSFIAPTNWTWTETIIDQRVIKEGNALIDWLYSNNQTIATLTRLPEDATIAPARPTPPTLPAFDDVVFPPRPQ